MALVCGVSSVHGLVGISYGGGTISPDTIVSGTTLTNRFTTSSAPQLEVDLARVVYVSSESGSFTAGIFESNVMGAQPDGADPGSSTIKCSFDTSTMNAGSCASNICDLPVTGGACVLSGDTNYWFYLTMNTSLGGGNIVLRAPDPTPTSELTPAWTGNVGSRQIYTTNDPFWAEDFNTSLFGVQVVPEPATYAMIFGVLAMGVVVVRRKLKRV